MPLYTYSKQAKEIGRKRFGRTVSYFMVFAGLSILTAVIYPIATFELYYAHKFADLTNPVVEAEDTIPDNISNVLGISLTDLTRASRWFPGAATAVVNPSNYNNYTLNIPKLKIDRANVLIGSDDLSKSLIQYTGSRPGTVGNPVIFGHSTLPLFYSPTDYKAIFTKLTDLTQGDEITVTYDGVSYTYKVFQMFITSPRDLKVLEQNTDEEQLTLITCVPPGTYLKRFIVKARLSV